MQILGYYKQNIQGTEFWENFLLYESGGQQMLTNGLGFWVPYKERMAELQKAEKADINLSEIQRRLALRHKDHELTKFLIEENKTSKPNSEPTQEGPLSSENKAGASPASGMKQKPQNIPDERGFPVTEKEYQEILNYFDQNGAGSIIYLEMKKGLTKEQFQETLNYFKQNGAIYDKDRKQWHITEKQRDKFTEYLPNPKEPAAQSRKESPAAETDTALKPGPEPASHAVQAGNETGRNGAAEHSPKEKAPVIYLEMKKGLSKTEFQETLNYFKQNGAIYDKDRKQWHITEKQRDKFTEYLPNPDKAAQERPRPSENKTNASPASGMKQETPVQNKKPEGLDLAEKQNAETGHRLYLEIKKGLSKKEFLSTVDYFKNSGAFFDQSRKQWYIIEKKKFGLIINDKGEWDVSDHLRCRFIEYLPPEEYEKTQTVLEDAARLQKTRKETEMMAKKDFVLDYFGDISREYIITLKNGDRVRMDEKEILKITGEKSIKFTLPVMDALEDRVREYIRVIPGNDYDITVNRASADNYCTVYFKENGVIPEKEAKSLKLYGHQFNVQFPTLETSEVSRIISDYMEKQKQEQTHKESPIQTGERHVFYVPGYTKQKNHIQYISGIKKIEGVILEVSEEMYSVKTDDGRIRRIKPSQIYDEYQKNVMEKAVLSGMTYEQLDIIGDVRLSGPKMEAVFNGFKDGLNIFQAASYASPKYEAWQMDIYRHGMSNGLPFDSITLCENWEDSRHSVDRLIKEHRNQIIRDLKGNNIIPEKQLVHKIEKLYAMTERMKSLKDISRYLNSDPADNEMYKLCREIGTEIKQQRTYAAKIPAPNQLPAPVR